ncbi:hypothetical protein ERHA55_31760 [Erwinia rhapontici]|nr:hypothetical protein [Erwinia rhapontici]BCQ45649.1 hypothetical protein ERHA55_31760 [Erwinia rhapontici]
MTQTARVSIIILAQYPMWLNEALDSALAQDYPHCEIIIADCSGDKLVGQHLAARPDVTQYPITHLVFEKINVTAMKWLFVPRRVSTLNY